MFVSYQRIKCRNKLWKNKKNVEFSGKNITLYLFEIKTQNDQHNIFNIFYKIVQI